MQTAVDQCQGVDPDIHVVCVGGGVSPKYIFERIQLSIPKETNIFQAVPFFPGDGGPIEYSHINLHHL